MTPKRILCLIGLHGWEERVREGEHYFVCTRCGKYGEAARALIRYPGSRP